MKLTTEKGQLDLPAGFAFTIEQYSPVVAKEGTQSIPATLPASSRNLSALGHPTRMGKSDKILRKISAKIESGIFQKDGQLVIDSAHSREGIIGAIMLNESDLYSRIKDVTLKEVFTKIIRDDFALSSNPVEAWYNHLFSCMKGETVDDFTLFPVAVNYSLEDGYQLLNAPDCKGNTDPWPLFYKARRITVGDETQNVPTGYGITPFMWLNRLLELLFAEWGYSLSENPFRTDSHLKKVVMLNNTADTICAGKIRYSDLVPSCTVAELLAFLENRFLMHAYIYPEAKRIDIVPLQSVLSGTFDEDLSSFIDGEIKHIYQEPMEVHISSDVSLEGAAAAMETIFDFNKKYKIVNELNEDDFRNKAWMHSIVKRKATGEYFEILRKMADSSVKINRLGTNYFAFYNGDMQGKEYKAQDLIPPMVEIDLGLIGTMMAKVVCPYIGARVHINTVFSDESNSEQKIIIALSAGKAESDTNISSLTYLGTTQKFNNLGIQWAQYDLTPFDLYSLYFSRWNGVLKNSTRTMECKIDYPTKSLLSFRMDKLKMLHGQKVLPESLSYTIGEKITHNSSRFIGVKPLNPVIEDTQISFTPQLYYWEYVNNALEVFAEFDTQEWESYNWKYINQDGTTVNPNTYEFIPPPTQEQFLSGGQHFLQENPISISAIRFNTYQTVIFEKALISYFRAVEIP